MKDRLTIITVTYNAQDVIEDTILSIINNQYFLLIEYIVIDGGSTDRTIDILNKYEAHIDCLISEPDKGIYDAMNKGLSRATAEWVLFINGGDTLISIPNNIIENLVSENTDLICGSIVTDCGNIIKPEISWKIRVCNTLPHQALFYRRTKMISAFNTKYKIFSDYDYNIQIFKKAPKIDIIADIIARHSLDGISNNTSHISELYRIICAHFGVFYVFLSFFRFKIQGLKKILSKYN